MTFDMTTEKSIAEVPKPTIAAPMRPPKSAWLDDDGSPSNHVTMFHTIAPMRPAKMSSGVISTPPGPSLMMPPEMVMATSVERNAPTRFRMAASADGDLRAQRARRDGRRHRVGRVVEAVREVEEERQRDDQHDDEGEIHRRLSLESVRSFTGCSWKAGSKLGAHDTLARMLRDGAALRHHRCEILTEYEDAANAGSGEHVGQPPPRVVPHLVERDRR